MSLAARGYRKLREILGQYVNREVVVERLEAARKAAGRIPRTTVLQTISLAVILAIAATIRLMPLRWGAYLSEFDPYIQFRIAEHIAKNGFASYFTFYDTMTWFPYGRNIPTTTYPGLAITAAALYRFLNPLGLNVTVYEFAIYFPVLFGVLQVLAIFLFSKDLWGRSVGLLAALFLAFSSSNISRTNLGFFDDETVGIFGMLLLYMFYLKAISPDRSLRSGIIYSILAGLSLSYVTLGWGAFRYPMDLLALFSAVLVLFRRYGRRLLIGYSITYAVQFLVTTQLPFLGYYYLTEWSTLAIMGVFLLMVSAEIPRVMQTRHSRLIAVGFFGAAFIASFLLAWRVGLISNVDQKFAAILNPFERLQLPLIESVAEHRPATWASFFFEFGALGLLGIFGFVFVIQRLRNADLFLAIYGATSLYFAASLVRLTLLLAPAMCVLGAIAVAELGKPSVDIIREAVIFPKRRVRIITRVGREFGVAIFLILLLALLPSFWRATTSAYSPVTIATSSIPTAPEAGQEQKFQDWIEALSWMRDNLPDSAVVFSWWDYGYWISTLGGKHSMADNGTINSTQIKVIAQTFLNNLTFAIPTLRKYNVTHIAIFVTHQSGQSGLRYQGYGEDGKWYWMARIGNNSDYGPFKIIFQEKRSSGGGQPKYTRVIYNGTKVVGNETIAESEVPNEKTLLGFMIKNALERSERARSPFLNLAFSSSNKYVLVFAVKYLTATHVTLGLSKTKITFGDSVTIRGNLTDETLKGISSYSVEIQARRPGIIDWSPLDRVRPNVNGSYTFLWKQPAAGKWDLRARFEGTEEEYLESMSETRSLDVLKANVTYTTRLSAHNVTLGKNVTVFVNFNATHVQGNVTLEYSLDNKTWTRIASSPPLNGTFNYTWTPPAEGTYYVRISYAGSPNHNATSSTIVIVGVRKQ